MTRGENTLSSVKMLIKATSWQISLYLLDMSFKLEQNIFVFILKTHGIVDGDILSLNHSI